MRLFLPDVHILVRAQFRTWLSCPASTEEAEIEASRHDNDEKIRSWLELSLVRPLKSSLWLDAGKASCSRVASASASFVHDLAPFHLGHREVILTSSIPMCGDEIDLVVLL